MCCFGKEVLFYPQKMRNKESKIFFKWICKENQEKEEKYLRKVKEDKKHIMGSRNITECEIF